MRTVVKGGVIHVSDGAIVHGDMVTRRLLIQEGSAVNGAGKMESVEVPEVIREPVLVSGDR